MADKYTELWNKTTWDIEDFEALDSLNETYIYYDGVNSTPEWTHGTARVCSIEDFIERRCI